MISLNAAFGDSHKSQTSPPNRPKWVPTARRGRLRIWQEPQRFRSGLQTSRRCFFRASGIAIDNLVLVPVWREAGDILNTRERVAPAWAETLTRVTETGIPCDWLDERLQSTGNYVPCASRCSQSLKYSISECFEHGHVHAWSSLLQGVAGLKAFLTHICVSGSDRTRFLA